MIIYIPLRISTLTTHKMFTLKVFQANFKVVKRFIWTVDTVGDDLVLRKNNKEELCYPHLWLRDNCQCSLCFHKTSNSRIINIEHFDFTSQPLKATVSMSLFFKNNFNEGEGELCIKTITILGHQLRSCHGLNSKKHIL